MEEQGALRRLPEGLEVPPPTQVLASDWKDDMERWPAVSYKEIDLDLVNYLLFDEGVDGEQMENYKSMESYRSNYFQSGKIDAVVICSSQGFAFLKAEMTPSRAVNGSKHDAWVMTTTDGVVETAYCSCTTGRGRTRSHAGAMLWKVSTNLLHSVSLCYYMY